MSESGAQEGQPRHAMTFRAALLGIVLAAVVGLGLALTQPFPFASPWVYPSLLFGVALAAATGWLTPPEHSGSWPVDPPPTADDVRSPALPSDVPNAEPDEVADDVDSLAALRHEFRTPLNAVLGFADVLLREIDGAVNESQREDLQIIRASGMKLQVLLDSALDLSRLAGGTFRPDTEACDVQAIVTRAAAETEQLWAGKRTVVASLPSEACGATLDAGRVRRCLMVLADVLGTQYRDSQVELRLTISDDRLAISVAATLSGKLDLEALPTPAEVVGAEDPMKIRRWPVAVSSEVVAAQGGSLYHGDDPARFVLRFPREGSG